MTASRAFTLQANRRLKIIKLKVEVAETPSSEQALARADKQVFWAMFDTSATHSRLSTVAIEKLGIEPVKRMKIETDAGLLEKNTYIVDIYLPNQIRVTPVNVVEMVRNQHFDCDVVVGMDIISRGDFSLANVAGKTMFSFRMPSLGASDFVALAASRKNTAVKKINTVVSKRHQMCHCGSGKFYKNCCAK